jgi:hypothetical protein
MSLSIYIIATALLISAGLIFVAWKYAYPYWRVMKFKKTIIYKSISKVQEEHRQNKVRPNQESKIVRGNKVYISEPINTDILAQVEANRDLLGEVPRDLFVSIIAKHIRDNPTDFRDYLECVSKNNLLHRQTHEKIYEILSIHGVPDFVEFDVLAKNAQGYEETFGIVVELLIDIKGKTLKEQIELPCDYIKWAYEKYEKVAS